MVTAKVNAPNYQAYEPTDLEKVFAQQMIASPDLGGTAFGMLMHYGGDRQRGIDQYTKDLSSSNALQVALAKQEMSNELTQTALKELAPVTNAGLPVQNMPLMAQFSNTGFTDPQSTQTTASVLQKRLAEIEELKAKAAASMASTGPQTTYQQVFDAQGNPGSVVVSTKGRGDIARDFMVNGVRAGAMYGNVPTGNAPFKRPNAVQQRQANLAVGPGGTVTLVPGM